MTNQRALIRAYLLVPVWIALFVGVSLVVTRTLDAPFALVGFATSVALMTLLPVVIGLVRRRSEPR